MTTATHQRPHHGGNRLAQDHPAHGRAPRYTRCRDWGPDPERRDRNQRMRTQRAAALAQAHGELSPHLAGVLLTLLVASDDQLTPGWWSLRWIARAVLGHEHYADGGGQRTAGRWMHKLAQLGWIQLEHRFEVDHGRVRGTSNRWRIVIPEPLRDTVHTGEDRARARTLAQRDRAAARPPARQQTDDRRTAADATTRQVAELRRHGTTCPTCAGDKWIAAPGEPSRLIRCASCAGLGVIPRAP